MGQQGRDRYRALHWLAAAGREMPSRPLTPEKTALALTNLREMILGLDSSAGTLCLGAGRDDKACPCAGRSRKMRARDRGFNAEPGGPGFPSEALNTAF